MTRHADWQTPSISIEVVDDQSATARCDQGFLKLRRLRLKNRYQDGTESAPYPYDVVDRAALDAVVMLLHRTGPDGVEVCIRSSLRPPLGVRTRTETQTVSVLWEVPAGLIEPEEAAGVSVDGVLPGVRSCAARETLEETGYVVPEERFEPLGRMTYLSPGVLAERLHYVVASLDGCTVGDPTLDGSPVEEGSTLLFVSLADAIAAVDRGDIQDAKTEVALRRFVASRASRGQPT
ncbi:MAG: NUDIX hydrolase [Polyangiales bacterium]